MLKKILALSLFAITSQAMANEEPLTVVCKNCIHSTSMEITAKEQAVLDETKTVYVINIEEEKVDKFEVAKVLSGTTFIDNGGEEGVPDYTTTAVNVGVDSEYQENFDEMMTDRREIQAEIDAWQYVDAGPHKSSVE